MISPCGLFPDLLNPYQLSRNQLEACRSVVIGQSLSE